jgi:hypothetical protein
MEDFNINHIDNDNSGVFSYYYSFLDDSDFEDSLGYPRIKDLDNRAMAKKVCADKEQQSHYYIRKGYDSKIYNPLSQIASKSKFNITDNSDNMRFKLVSKKAFDLFMIYLSTKDIKILNQTEREV